MRASQLVSSVSSFTQSCPTLCDPMNCSTPSLPVHHWLPELAQTHVHQVCDAIQPSHPLSSPSPPAFNLSQYQGLFQWVSSSHEVAKVLELQLQHQSFKWIFPSYMYINVDSKIHFYIHAHTSYLRGSDNEGSRGHRKVRNVTWGGIWCWAVFHWGNLLFLEEEMVSVLRSWVICLRALSLWGVRD